MSTGFGQLPSFANLSASDLADLFQRLQQTPQDPRDTGPQPNTQGVPPEANGLGALALGGRGAPPLAMNEAQTQALERAQAGPQDAAALGGSPTDRLLFDRSGMGGGANAFVRGPGQVGAPGFPDTGSIDQRVPDHPGATPGPRLPDPSATGSVGADASRLVPLPPQRPDDAPLAMLPAVAGTNPGASTASSYPGEMPAKVKPLSDYPGGPTAASAPQMAPVNSFDPLTGQVISGQPQPLGRPQAPAAASAPGIGQGGPQPSILERFANGLNHPDFSNLMLSIGTGLLTHRGFSEGVGAGLQSYQQSRLGNVKQQLEQFKLMQAVKGQQDQRNYLIKKGHSPDAADAMIANPTLLTNQLGSEKPNYQTIGGNVYDMSKNGGTIGQGNLVGPSSGPPAGYRLAADGKSLEFIPGGEADPAVKERNAKAVATDKEQTPLLDIDARRKVGIPDNDTRAAWADPNGKVTFNDGPPLIQGRPGQTVYERGTMKPILTVPSAKPDGFETESKLRGEFSKQLGTFADVHDGYGRLIAATKQRQENPGSVSPASDISLVFGYMKMLDPGSVVREGEYATAKNAAGVPERVLNAYNKALTGEFLSDAQRKDFLGQASELYGTARKTAEGVAERYRNLATSYGADPGRAVYLPEAPTPPKLGQQSQSGGAAAGRFQELTNSGMSKADAFAQMRKEGL